MKAFCSLRAAKDRKKKYRSKKRMDKDRSAHNLSDSMEEGKISESEFCSSQVSGTSSGPPSGNLELATVPAVLSCGGLLTGGQELVPRATAGGRPGGVTPICAPTECHLQQVPSGQVGLVRTDDKLTTPARTWTGFDTSMESELGRIAYQFRDLSPHSQVRKMKEFLNQTDPSLSSYSSRKSRSRSVRSKDDRNRMEDAYFKSADRARKVSASSEGHISQGVTVASVYDSGVKRKSCSVSPGKKRVRVSEEWARMLEKGGAVWKSDAVPFFVIEGVSYDVVLPRDGSGEKTVVGQGLGVTPFPLETRVAPHKTSFPEVVRQSQGSRGQVDSVKVSVLTPVEAGPTPSSASRRALVTSKSGWVPASQEAAVAVESPGGPGESTWYPGYVPSDFWIMLLRD